MIIRIVEERNRYRALLEELVECDGMDPSYPLTGETVEIEIETPLWRRIKEAVRDRA